MSALVADALAPVRSRCEGRPAVAVREADTPRAAVSGDGLYVAASVMKVNILAALLPGRQDEPPGRARELTVAGEVTAAAGTAGADPWELSARESAQAEAVIERSDNDAANALWRAAGGAEGIARANRRLGLTRTEPHRSDPWGLSCTTAADQLTLLEAVFGRGPDPLRMRPAGWRTAHASGSGSRWGGQWARSAGASPPPGPPGRRSS